MRKLVTVSPQFTKATYSLITDLTGLPEGWFSVIWQPKEIKKRYPIPVPFSDNPVNFKGTQMCGTSLTYIGSSSFSPVGKYNESIFGTSFDTTFENSNFS